jgi:hypothetical protein
MSAKYTGRRPSCQCRVPTHKPTQKHRIANRTGKRTPENSPHTTFPIYFPSYICRSLPTLCKMIATCSFSKGINIFIIISL